MPVVEVKGDLLTSDCTIIGHGSNCFHTMGSGVAHGVRKLYPEAYEADKRTAYGEKTKLGYYSYAHTKNKTVVNLYTQYDFGNDSRKLDYEALASCLAFFHKMIRTKGHGTKAGLPRIGCGLAGGDWNIVKAFLEAEFKEDTIYIYSL